MAESEALREALFELNTLREREAAALRESNAILDGLARVNRSEDPGGAVRGLLASIRTSLGCAAVALVGERRDAALVSEATEAALLGAVLPARPLLAGRARRVVDLAEAGPWRDLPDAFARYRSLLSVPIRLPEGERGALLCLARAPAAFTPGDQSLLERLSALAGPALERRALAERNALLAAVVEGSAASVVIADATRADLPIVHVNEAFVALSGYARDEVLGRNCRFLSAEAPDAPERRRLRRTIADRCSGTFVLLNRRQSGELFWNRLTLFPVGGQEGAARYMVATQVDITAERAAEAARDEARRRLVGALSAASEGFLLVDRAGRVVFANARYRDFFEDGDAVWDEGVQFADTWARRLVHLGTPPEEARRIGAERQAALLAGGRDREKRLPDGRVLLVNDRMTGDGGAVSIATDVTSLKATERILAQRAAAMDSTRDGIAVTDDAGRFVYMNPSHLAMFGYAEESEVLGRPWSILYAPDQAAYVERVGMPELERTGTWRTEISGLSKTGEPVPQEISLTFLPGLGIVCVTRDISERIRAERERERLREQLHAAQRQEAIGQLAAGVAHDFNNLLSVMTASASLMARGLDAGSPLHTHADRILAAGQRAASLVSRLLHVNTRRAERATIDLAAVFAEAADLLRAGVPSRIRVAVAAPARPVLADADQTEFLQVALNLGINARDAIGPRAGEIGLSLAGPALYPEPETARIGWIDPARRYALLTVSDTGAGMEEEHLAQIFRPYFTTKGAAGTGLGLAVVSSIVGKAGGAVAVSSRPGEGAVFRVYWPVDDAAAEEPAAPAAPPPAEQVPDLAPDLAGATVLVCDDEPAVAQVLAAALEARGAECAVCEDPRDALEAVEESPEAWSLLVTDYDMPPMTGAELAAAVRAAAPDLPILLCTALAEMRRTGPLFDATLAKPVDPDRLAAAAAAAIRQRAATPPTGPECEP